MKVEIRKLGARGDGIADGPVYVPSTLPGETVEGEVIDGHMAAARIITPSSDRVKPPCPHFKTCGGCVLQHASDSFVEDWKRNFVVNALAAQGLEAPIVGVVTSPARARIRATFTGRRTKKGAMVGFHARGSDMLVDIPSCVLLHPAIIAARPVLETLTRLGATRTVAVELTVTHSVNGLDVAISHAIKPDAAMLANLGRITQEHALARLSWNGEIVALRVPPVQHFGATAVTPPPGAFLQATNEGRDALTRAVLGIVADAHHVIDLFSGCGTFTLPLAQTAEVLAVESEETLLQALDAGWRHGDGLRRVTTLKRDLFRNPLMPDELAKTDAVVIDPPRAGARAQCEMLANARIPRIAYVSCNPATFARDAKILTDSGYTLDHVLVVDQFRWSTHVELVASFTKV